MPLSESSINCFCYKIFFILLFRFDWSRSLRISIPYLDPLCSTSEPSECEPSTYQQPTGAPIEIITNLYLGNVKHSEDLESLQRHNIKYILNVTPDLPNKFEASGAIKYLKIPITDHGSQDLQAHFPAAIEFIGMTTSNLIIYVIISTLLIFVCSFSHLFRGGTEQ